METRKRLREEDVGDDENKRRELEELRMERKRLQKEARAAARAARRAEQIKYPIEDLDLPDALNPPVSFPKPSSTFDVPAELVTYVLAAWSFCQCFGCVAA